MRQIRGRAGGTGCWNRVVLLEGGREVRDGRLRLTDMEGRVGVNTEGARRIGTGGRDREGDQDEREKRLEREGIVRGKRREAGKKVEGGK